VRQARKGENIWGTFFREAKGDEPPRKNSLYDGCEKRGGKKGRGRTKSKDRKKQTEGG